MIRLHGQPFVLDRLLRVPLRVVQLLVGGGLSLVLAWMDLWWWVPVPLALSFLVFELFFWRRGDRAVDLELGDRLTVVDPVRGQRLDLDPADVTVASILHRPGPPGTHDVWFVLSADTGPLLAARVRTRAPFAARPTDLDARLTDAMLGGDAGSVRALAPNDRVVRQIVDDPKAEAVRWLRERIPVDAWSRTGARVWKGAQPGMDILGHFEGPADAFLVLEGDRFRIDGSEQVLGPLDAGCSGRQVVLFGEALQDQELPMLVLDLDADTPLVCPAPIGGTLGERRDLEERMLHTHGAEGALVVWHVLRNLPEDGWPETIRQALDEARTAVPEAWEIVRAGRAPAA